MAPSRKIGNNGRSPIVNQQRQITSFFNKSTSSSPSPNVTKSNPKLPSTATNPNPNFTSIHGISNKTTRVTPSPQQSKPKKSVLIVGHTLNPVTPGSVAKLLGDEVVNRRLRVYWPSDKCSYEGCVKSFDGLSGKHFVQYDDAEEEELDLNKEKIEWIDGGGKSLRRLRRTSVVIDDDDEEEKAVTESGEDDDSMDEDWGATALSKVVDEVSEDTEPEKQNDDDDIEEIESSKQTQIKISVSRKRKTGPENLVSAKKSKIAGKIVSKADSSCLGSYISPSGNTGSIKETTKNEGDKTLQLQNAGAVGDASERFGIREAEKFQFLGAGRKDANKRSPDDLNYDPRTLYLPPNFLKNLSGCQRQWWDFKSKHMDKIILFKMGKFYELFEMDAHIGTRELDLQYMKGEQPHCGFPEKNFSVNLEKLARKGYRVLVVEQTETPEQLELRRKEKGSKDKVVNREICAVVTKGTLTEGEMMSANPDSSYIMAVTESTGVSDLKNDERVFGVCIVDVATSKIVLGQFADDTDCSILCSMLSALRPVEIIKPAKLLSSETEKVLVGHTRNPLVNELVPSLEFWESDKTICYVNNIYRCIKNKSIAGHPNEVIACAIDFDSEEIDTTCLPDVLSELVSAGKDGSYALSALGGSLFYLKQAFLDETLLRFAKFELLPCSGFSDIPKILHMVLDAAALDNLEIFENSRSGDSSGTLYAQLNHCVTAFGKRLLKTWLARPLYHHISIKERQDAVAGLRGVNLPLALDFRKALSRLPDMERLLVRLFASSEANGRNANKVVLYEDAAKKQLQEFISVLRGCELMTQACSSLNIISENVDSSLLQQLLTPGRGLPDIHSILNIFKDSFDWVEANSSGRIIPHDGADPEYDSASKMVKEIEYRLMNHLGEQKKLFGKQSISYVTVGKDTHLLEVPESLCNCIPRNYELRSSKKGFFRYWNPTIKKLLGDLSLAESKKESKLKNILQRLIERFCEHHNMWRQLISAVAELDVLISLAIARDYYEGPTCRPIISEPSCSNEVPRFAAKSLGHPVLRSDFLGKGAFVPNDISVGGSDLASFILLTGPNMGGKSTLLRQVCLAVILAQVGADVPAESFQLSPVDQIFVRMGAKDQIMAGQSTFLTELSETASMLSSATRNSLVALDELGRGTSTSDGQAIAESVLEYFIHKVHCRGLFSTHYHRLAMDYQTDAKVLLCHMGCQIKKSVGGVEEVTFLYKLMPGACPKSHGVNVARLAGLPDSVLERAAAKSIEFESQYGARNTACSDKAAKNWDGVISLMQELFNMSSNLSVDECSETASITMLTELQHRANMLLQQAWAMR